MNNESFGLSCVIMILQGLKVPPPPGLSPFSLYIGSCVTNSLLPSVTIKYLEARSFNFFALSNKELGFVRQNLIHPYKQVSMNLLVCLQQIPLLT